VREEQYAELCANKTTGVGAKWLSPGGGQSANWLNNRKKKKNKKNKQIKKGEKCGEHAAQNATRSSGRLANYPQWGGLEYGLDVGRCPTYFTYDVR